MGTEEVTESSENRETGGGGGLNPQLCHPKNDESSSQTSVDETSDKNCVNQEKNNVKSNNLSLSTAGKKIRRAFSMPRNPFRWSRKFKTNNHLSHTSGNHDEILCNQSAKITNVRVTIGTSESDSSQSGEAHERSHKRDSASRVLFRRSSFRKFLNRIAQHVSSGIGAHKQAAAASATNSTISDRVPPIGGYQWPADQTPGVTGLKNHGNTCFMNAVLQCLSHTDILAEYFVLDQYKVDLKRRNKINSRKFGTKGELTEQLANVLKALWMCKNESEHSTTFKAVVDRYGTQFRSSTQQDAQEFLFWLLDKVHEDLNTARKRRYKSVKNTYGRPDEVLAAETLANHIRCNNSFVQAVFQAQFRSSLTCPRCKKQSNTFDPFHCISVQLPQLAQQVVFVTVLYLKKHPGQVKLGLTIPAGSPIIVLREKLHLDTGIAKNRIVLADINEIGFSRVFYDSQPISTLEGVNSIYCIEVPELNAESTDLMLLVANVHKLKNGNVKRFGTPFCLQANRDCTYVELQKKLLKEMSGVLKSEVFAYTTPLTEMFQIRLQDPSADPDTYLEQVEHPLFTEIIDMALSVLSSDAGPAHVKLLLEWPEPEEFFVDMSDPVVEHESVSRLKETNSKETALTLQQCLEHYTKAETLSAEDAWRCPHCQQYLPVVKMLGLWSLPDILVIHFKRFRQHHDKGADAAKLTTMVKFPLNAFDMSPHLAKEAAAQPGDSLNRKKMKDLRFKEVKDTRYDLYAVCYHQGDTLETGHYTAACKNPYDHQWYKFDDQRVSRVESDRIQEEIINNEAYILFYQRRNIDSSECSGSSTSSSDHWVSKIAIAPATNATTGSSICGRDNEEKVPSVADVKAEKSPLGDQLENIKTDPIISEDKQEEVVEISTTFNELTDLPISAPNATLDLESYKSQNEFAEVNQSINEPNHSTPEPPIEPTDSCMSPKNTQLTASSTSSSSSDSLSLSSQPIPIARPSSPKINGFNGHASSTSFKEALSSSLKSNNSLMMSAIGNDLCRFNGNASGHNLRHSFSTSSNYKLKECSDTLSSMLAGCNSSASTCSKDTLIFIDQQGHGLIDDDDAFLNGSRSLWISPVTPHKLITVSPKN